MAKTMLKVLECGKKERPPVGYETIYLNGMIRAMEAKQLAPDDKTLTKRIIFYTVKYLSIVNVDDLPSESLDGLLVFNQVVLNQVSELTPAELLTIFPVTKSYDGARYECKDYYSTMEALQAHGLHEQIRSKETASSLLWDYMNPIIMMFQVHYMSAISKLHAMHTGKGLMEQFFEEQGVKVGTVRKYETDDGQTFMIGDDGRSFPVKKPVPRYLNLVN